jgi:crotonobetainyl-CoA:carnitine CoA-transferase CaiB-like acyl-CoA transferase
VVSPLKGRLVADFSRVLAGPLATMTLADLGARVIKVERPGAGDDTRSWGPPFSATGSTYFESVNRNKESVCLDLRVAADRALAFELAARADVVVENFAPGTMDSYGLGYDAVRLANRGVVYASISGFGAGAGASIPGYDFVVQALGGLMSITGESDGEPLKVGVALVDVLTAKDVAIGVLAALVERDTSGLGARLEFTLLTSLAGGLANQAQAWLGAGVSPRRLGNVHPSIAPYQALACADGPIAVAVGNDSQFAKLCAVIRAPHLASDPRFRANPDRVRNRDALVPLLERELSGATAIEWESRLTAAGVPAGHVATIAEGLELAASLGLEPTIEVEDSSGRVVATQVRHPARWTPSLDPRRDAPPRLGEHDSAIRDWLNAPRADPKTDPAPATPAPATLAPATPAPATLEDDHA